MYSADPVLLAFRGDTSDHVTLWLAAFRGLYIWGLCHKECFPLMLQLPWFWALFLNLFLPIATRDALTHPGGSLRFMNALRVECL